MATTTPIRESILLDIITDLKTIKIANSYRTEVLDSNISRLLKSPDEMDDTDFPALFLSDGPESMEPGVARVIKANMQAIVTGYVRYNKDNVSDNIPSVQLNKLMADVKEAIMTSTSAVWTNGNVELVNLLNLETDRGFIEPEGAFELIVSITYRHRHDDTGAGC